MEELFTAWFDLINDSDMLAENGEHTVVLTCPICHAIFETEIKFLRIIIPWTGNHPADKNTKVITEKVSNIIETRGSFCACKAKPIRVLSAKHLHDLVEENFYFGQK